MSLRSDKRDLFTDHLIRLTNDGSGRVIEHLDHIHGLHIIHQFDQNGNYSFSWNVKRDAFQEEMQKVFGLWPGHRP